MKRSSEDYERFAWERLLHSSNPNNVAIAQVHATLAVAAATHEQAVCVERCLERIEERLRDVVEEMVRAR